MLQIHRLEISTDDAVPDHLRRPSLFGHLVGIEGLCNAGAAVCPMGAFKARVKAIVPVGPVAMAIARHLVHHSGGLGCCPVGFLLRRRSISAIGELLFR